MSCSKPKIVYNEDCLDLRDHFEKDMTDPIHKKLCQNPYLNKDWTAKPRSKQERNEVVNTALKKLAKTYNTNNCPKVRTRTKEHSFYGPYRKKFSDSHDADSLKSKSELVTLIKEGNNHKGIFPSSPTIQSSYENRDFPKKTEAFKNKFTMTKKTIENQVEQNKEGKSLKRDKSIDKLIDKFRTAEQVYLNTKAGDSPVWKDQRLSEKYSLLKVPWKRSHTLPVCAQPSTLVKEAYKRKILDNSDKKTYLYDDGSEVDSSYVEAKQVRYFGFTVQNKVLMLLNMSAYVCALLVICLIVWIISGNKTLYKLLIPKPPESTTKRYIKLVGGSIIYAITSIVRLIGSIFAIPTQQVYHPATDYSWPPVH